MRITPCAPFAATTKRSRNGETDLGFGRGARIWWLRRRTRHRPRAPGEHLGPCRAPYAFPEREDGDRRGRVPVADRVEEAVDRRDERALAHRVGVHEVDAELQADEVGVHVAAAAAYRDGYKRAAETVLQIADDAERELMGRAGAR